MPEFFNYTINIKSSPTKLGLQIPLLRLCQQITQSEYSHLSCIFLQEDAVYLSSSLSNIPDGEIAIQKEWQAFINNFAIPCYACINSALRRGIYDEKYANMYHQPVTIVQGIQLAGLGTFYEALDKSHRCIQL